MAIARTATAGSSSVTQQGTQTTTQSEQNALGKDDFLKLLVTQLKYNDINSSDNQSDQQFIAQMAQFSTLEQMTNLNTTISQSMKLQSFNQSAYLIGHEVTALSPEGEKLTGKVTKIEFTDGNQFVTVGDTQVSADSIISIS